LLSQAEEFATLLEDDAIVERLRTVLERCRS